MSMGSCVEYLMKNISKHLGRPFATTIKPLGQAFAKLLFKSLQVS